jgi:hypothetical protein
VLVYRRRDIRDVAFILVIVVFVALSLARTLSRKQSPPVSLSLSVALRHRSPRRRHRHRRRRRSRSVIYPSLSGVMDLSTARFARLPRAAALRTPRRAAKLCQSRSTLVARSPLRKGERASTNRPASYLRTRGAPRDVSRRDAASRSARNIRRRRAHFRDGGVAFSPTRCRTSDVRPFRT